MEARRHWGDGVTWPHQRNGGIEGGEIGYKETPLPSPDRLEETQARQHGRGESSRLLSRPKRLIQDALPDGKSHVPFTLREFGDQRIESAVEEGREFQHTQSI